MGGGGGCEGFEIVAAFEGRDDASAAVILGHRNDEPGDPGEVIGVEMEVSQRVVGVGVEARGDEDELGLEFLEGGNPVALDGLAKGGSAGAGRERSVDDMVADEVEVSVGVVRVLEAGGDEHAGGILENIDGAIAVVHVEIEDGHALDVLVSEGGGGSEGDIVVKTEAHAGIVFRVMSGRATTGEDSLHVAVEDEGDCFFQSSGGESGCLQ